MRTVASFQYPIEREPEGSLCGRKKVMEAGRGVEPRQSPYESDLRPPLPATKNTY